MALRVEIEPAGFAPEALQRLTSQLLDHATLRRELAGTEYRLIGLRPVEGAGRKSPAREREFRATLYDYTNQRAVEVSGSLSPSARAGRALDVRELGHQPLPSREEFDLAVQWLTKDGEWGHLLADEGYTPIPHVPPVVPVDSGGRTRRAIGVQLVPRAKDAPFRTAAVDIALGEVREIEGRGSVRADCGFAPANQGTVTNRPGAAWISVFDGSTRLWRFLARRPAGSSGTNGSGVDLRYVDYRGRRVLSQAHVPILNVHYDANRCGPFLDWQNEESRFSATGTTPVPGFRLCSAPPQSILESGTDQGNFAGVAVYVDGDEVLVMSEMEAGWYRYISSWRFHRNGTIKPRFGFSAVRSACVCNRHHHHAYWRFDFDIRTAGHNAVREFNDPPQQPGQPNWHTIPKETHRSRKYGSDRKWRVVHLPSHAAYDIVPGPDDGVASQMPDAPFGQSDVWVLRYRRGEIDHGVVATGPPYRADLDDFDEGQVVRDRDVVVWYGAHSTHDVTEHAGHVVGPDLVPINW